MMELLLEPLQYGFMLRGLAAAVLVGIVCAVVGTYVVLRGMAFYGDALAHTILPGVAVGYLLSGSQHRDLFLWGLGAAILSAVGIGTLTHGARVREDTAIGIIFAGMFALGIAIISTVRDYTVDLTHFLFGNVLGVTAADLLLTGGTGAAILLIVAALFKEFMIVSFDPVLARTLRLPARALDLLLMTLIAVAIVVSLQTVGIALMVAMLVTPAATAQLVTRRLATMMVAGAALAAFAGVAGLYISYYAGIASGAAIVLVATALFALAWGARTLVSQRREHHQRRAETIG